MITTITHQCGHKRNYDWPEEEIKERSANIQSLDCPSCAASKLMEERLGKRVEGAFRK